MKTIINIFLVADRKNALNFTRLVHDSSLSSSFPVEISQWERI